MLALASCVASAVAAVVPQPGPSLPSWPPCPAEFAGSTRMWRGVVARALLDAFGLDLGNEGREQAAVTISRARSWLGRPTVDRDAVLDLAGIEPGDLDRRLPKLRELWVQADAGELRPETVGMRQRRRRCFGREVR